MKPEELIPGQRYRLREGLSPSIEAGLKGTDRIVELASSIPSCNEYTFMWRNYTDCIATVRAEDVECWIPRIGEEALFWDEHYGRPRKEKMAGYVCDRSSPFYSHYNSRRYCKPLPKEAEPVPDRNQTFEPAELEAMQEEMANALKPESDEPLYGPTELNTGHNEQPRYAALKKRLTKLEDRQDKTGAWHYVVDGILNTLKSQQGSINIKMMEFVDRLEALEAKDADIDRWQKNIGRAVDGLIDRANGMEDMFSALSRRIEALEAKDEDLSSWQKRFGDTVDRLTARMNLIYDKVNKL